MLRTLDQGFDAPYVAAMLQASGVIKHLPLGMLQVELPDGSVERVPAHRSDIAVLLAMHGDHAVQRRKPRAQRQHQAPAPAKAAPSASGFTRGQVHMLADVLKPVLRPVMARLDALEGKGEGADKGASSVRPSRPKSREAVLARVAVAQARAAMGIAQANAVLRRC